MRRCAGIGVCMPLPPPPPPKRLVVQRATRPGALRVGSLFSGIAGLELGLGWAARQLGMEIDVAFFCERDLYATSVLNRHYPGAPVIGDVRNVKAADVGEIDVLAGGFPCQPFSTAGSRKGQDDERFLWPECARLMRELKPTVAIWENVPGLQNINGIAGEDHTKGHVFKRVLDDVAAAGYRVEWDHVPASAVGAWHRRDRLFIVCRRDDVEAWGGVAEVPFGLPMRLFGGFGPLEWPRAGTRVGARHYARDPRYPVAGGGEPWPTPMAGGASGGTRRGGSGAPPDLEKRLHESRRDYPTPCALDANNWGAHKWESRQASGKQMMLEHAIGKIAFPTQTAFEGNSTTDPSETWHVPLRDAAMRASGVDPGKETTDPVLSGGMLNPDWVEWLMFFPVGWTLPPFPVDGIYEDVRALLRDLIGDTVEHEYSPPSKPLAPLHAAVPLTWHVEPAIPRLTLVEDHRADRLRCVGNAVCPRVAFEVGLAALRGGMPKSGGTNTK